MVAMHTQALLIEALSTVIVAPVIGVAVRSLRARVVVLGLLLVLSFVAQMVGGGLSPATFGAFAAAHATIGAAAFALAAIGALCRAACDDALDAIGLTAIVGAVAGFGVFLLGNFATELPTPLLNSALTANPIVATASAANIDIFRGALLYQFSPIAHREFQYPDWQLAAALYSGIAIAASLATARACRARAAAASPHQHD